MHRIDKTKLTLRWSSQAARTASGPCRKAIEYGSHPPSAETGRLEDHIEEIARTGEQGVVGLQCNPREWGGDSDGMGVVGILFMPTC